MTQQEIEKVRTLMQSEIAIEDAPRYLTVAQLAARLQVSTSTIYGWVDRDVVPFLMAGDLLRFDPAAIDSWMATRAARKRDQKRTSFVRMIK
jgi:excisionase family DNA binding protein